VFLGLRRVSSAGISERGWYLQEPRYGLKRYEAKHGGDLPRGFETQLEEQGGLAARLERETKGLAKRGQKLSTRLTSSKVTSVRLT